MLNQFSGEIIWKSYLEHNPDGLFYGNPYYYITQINKIYYLWKWDLDKKEYIALKSSANFVDLNKEVMSLVNEIDKALKSRSRDL